MKKFSDYLCEMDESPFFYLFGEDKMNNIKNASNKTEPTLTKEEKKLKRQRALLKYLAAVGVAND